MTTLTNGQFNELKGAIRGEILQASDAAYDAARTVWNAMIDRHPAIIVRCAGTADVCTALAYARNHGLPLAVRGGGHNIAGRALCEDGLVIDLSGMRSVQVDPRQRRARVEGGPPCATSTTKPSPTGWQHRWVSIPPPVWQG
jgi:FAD/FMN-containing dehydrogenase